MDARDRDPHAHHRAHGGLNKAPAAGVVAEPAHDHHTAYPLSPARRPVRVTRDLAGFWRTTYFEVRKDLKGRYPKHAWPDDPLRAEARRGR